MKAATLDGRRALSRPNEKLSVGFRSFLTTECQALLARLKQLKSFGLSMPMVGAANISLPAQRAIHLLLKQSVQELKSRILTFRAVLRDTPDLEAWEAQKGFTTLKLRFNWLLDSLDIFADALTMRSEHNIGVWLAGMDALAEDTLQLKGRYFRSPPLITYLDRGHGAAIRRARTRLPGGKSNPVAIIRVPRERMISTGIASSLIHEVGHQGASLLNLVPSVGEAIKQMALVDVENLELWNWLDRWISEILSDFWSVASIGIGSTMGLMNVVSVPAYFVFRLRAEYPHPPPWIRVQLSIAIGAALYPDPQWDRLKVLWNRLYPLRLAQPNTIETYKGLVDLLPAFTHLLLEHRPKLLRGKSLKEVFPIASRQPARLRHLYHKWKGSAEQMRRHAPSLVFAVIGQARADGALTPLEEAKVLERMLRYWAVRRTIF